MASSSLHPILDLEIPDLAVKAWIEVVRHALTRGHEIETQRLNYHRYSLICPSQNFLAIYWKTKHTRNGARSAMC